MAIEVVGVAPLLQVHDMPTSVRFYRDLLGFEVVSTSPQLAEDYFHWCLLRLGSAEVMLNTRYESNDERPAAPDTGGHEDVCLYFGCPDVDAAYLELRARGVPAQAPRVAPYGMKQMYLKDPDGFGLCFQWGA